MFRKLRKTMASPTDSLAVNPSPWYHAQKPTKMIKKVSSENYEAIKHSELQARKATQE